MSYILEFKDKRKKTIMIARFSNLDELYNCTNNFFITKDYLPLITIRDNDRVLKFNTVETLFDDVLKIVNIR